MKFRLIIFLVLILLISTTVQALSSYTVLDNSLSSCSCIIISNPIFIENMGLSMEFYSVTQEGTAADWAKVFPATLSLKPGETIEITNLINPPCGVFGNYELITNIVSTNDQRSFKQDIELNNCANYKISAGTLSKQGCSCVSYEFDFWITNTGNYDETFDLSTSKLSQYSTVTSPIMLAPGESEQVVIYISPCEEYGKQDLTVNIVSDISKFKAEVPISLELENCQDTQDTNSTQINKKDIISNGKKVLLGMIAFFGLILLILVLIFIIKPKAKTYYKKIKIKPSKRKKKFPWKKILLILLILLAISVFALTMFKLIKYLLNTLSPITPIIPTNFTNKTSPVKSIKPKISGFPVIFLKSVFNFVKNLLIKYYPYMLLGLIVLAVIILVLTQIKKKRK